MAQSFNKDKRKASRAIACVRQRPHLLAAGLIALCLVALAVMFGVQLAGTERQTLIERSGAVALTDGGSVQDEAAVKTAQASTIVVDVSGAVVTPGVYELADGARVSDAIEAAGGLADEADVSTLNRASKVTDGMKITVPSQGQAAPGASGESGDGDASGASSQASGLVNINTASVDELQTLSGVGPSTAQAIVEDREKNGLFASAEDLMRVSGIGEKKFAKIKDSICT